jgi:23S rRNA (guanine745-N1)-methyltransferase
LGDPNAALLAVLPSLACPVCGAGFAEAGQSVRCGNGHSYDIARQGYLNLQAGRAGTGTADTTAMATARERFLGEGHYAPIADALAELASAPGSRLPPGIVLDLAGGTGYYLAAVLDSAAGRTGICLDASKAALRRAARRHPRAAAVGADVWGRLPVASGSAAIVMSVFGPRNPGESARVLAPGGTFLLVTPTASHLRELIGPLGMLTIDPEKPRRLAASMTAFVLLEERTLTYRVDLPHGQIRDLVAMGPSGRHVSPADLESRPGALPEPAPTTISVRIAAYGHVSTGHAAAEDVQAGRRGPAWTS